MTRKVKTAAKPRRSGAAEAFCDARLGLGRVTLDLSDLVKASGLSALAAKRQLSRLRGKVVRISPRQSFYLILSPEHRSMGAPPPNWWLQDYFNWLGRPYYLALQSAASAFGSNPQALQVTQVMTDKPLRPINVGRTQLRFFVKRGIELTPTQQPDGAVAPLLISTPEATAYDLIRYATSIGGIERAAETIRPILPLLRARELKRMLNAEGESGVAQRLGFVMEACGSKSLAKVVRDWLPDELTPVALVPGKGKRDSLPLVKRWQVLNNSGELKFKIEERVGIGH
jgi:hypothetical protein